MPPDPTPLRRGIQPAAGDRFGRWVVVAVSPSKTSRGGARLQCRCDCGTVRDVTCGTLKNGTSRSCGCLKNELTSIRSRPLHTTHGMCDSPEWTSWQAMIQRCRNPKNPKFPRYGGRGITVCERWAESFEAFYEDMGLRPDGTTLDRYPDNNGNYEPGNCRWATPSQQARNRRTSRLLEHDGHTRSLAEWSEIKGLEQDLVWNRLRSGWTVDRALNEPVNTGYHIKVGSPS